MKILFFANTDWYLFNFRLDLARFLQDKGCEVVMISPPGKYGPRFAKIGFRWIALPMQRKSLNPIREANLLRLLKKIYHDEQPDLIHNFTIKCVVYGSLAAKAAGIDKRINAVTGLGHVFISNSLKALMLRPVVRQLLRTALQGDDSFLILQNPDDLHKFIDLNLIDADHACLIKGSGVNTNYFVPTERDRGSEFTILLASRLLKEKGIQTFVDAAEILKNTQPELHFVLAGTADPGNPSAITQAQLENWKKRGIIKVLGHIEDVRKLMNTVDLMVLPSHREGVPRSLIEAASMEIPLIATDVPGCREIVEHGLNGFLIPIDNPAALAKKIIQLYENPQLCRQFGTAGRQKVQQEFGHENVFKQTLEVYRKAGLAI